MEITLETIKPGDFAMTITLPVYPGDEFETFVKYAKWVSESNPGATVRFMWCDNECIVTRKTNASRMFNEILNAKEPSTIGPCEGDIDVLPARRF